MTQLVQTALFDNVDGHSAIAVTPLAKAGTGIIFSSIIPLHPTITSIWCPPNLISCADKTLVLLKNPGATGLKPVISSIISPVSSSFIAEVLLLRDSCLAKEKKLMEEEYFQLDFLADLFDNDKNS